MPEYRKRAVEKAFFLSENVVEVAEKLIGKLLIIENPKVICAGIIAETEAYAGIHDKASHAYNNRITPRTSVMFREGGCCYVYLCYGMHHMFNVVTAPAGQPHAVLVRGVIPLWIQDRESGVVSYQTDKKNANGPGKMSKWMGITSSLNGSLINHEKVWIVHPEHEAAVSIERSSRIGVAYAQEDAFLPYRFVSKDYLPAVKKKRPKFND